MYVCYISNKPSPYKGGYKRGYRGGKGVIPFIPLGVQKRAPLTGPTWYQHYNRDKNVYQIFNMLNLIHNKGLLWGSPIFLLFASFLPCFFFFSLIVILFLRFYLLIEEEGFLLLVRLFPQYSILPLKTFFDFTPAPLQQPVGIFTIPVIFIAQLARLKNRW